MSGIGPVMCRIKPVMSKIGLGNGNDVRGLEYCQGQYSVLPGCLAIFRTSNFEVRNTARRLGSVPDLTGAIPDLTGAILDVTGTIPDLTGPQNSERVRNSARRPGSIPDIAFFQVIEVRNTAREVRNSVSEVRNSASEFWNTARWPGSIPYLKL